MKKILQYILPFELPRKFPDNTLSDLYEEWDKPSRQIQISAISGLTALLYVTFTFIDTSSWASEQVQTLMHFVQKGGEACRRWQGIEIPIQETL